MSIYDDLLEPPEKPNAPPTPTGAQPVGSVYDSLFDEPSGKAALAIGSAGSPDKAAEAATLARRYNLPPAVAAEFAEDYKARAKVEDARDAFDRHPRLGNWAGAQPERAAMVQDDLGTLGEIERTVRAYGGAIGEGAIGRGAGATLTGFGQVWDIAARSLAAPFVAVGGDRVREFLDTPIPSWLDPAQVLMKKPGEALKGVGKSMAPAQTTFGTDVASGLGQVGFQAVQQILTGGTGSLASLFAQGADVMAEKVAGDAAPQSQKDLAVLGGAGITAVTEKWALDKILGPLAVPIKNKMAAALARIGVAGASEGGQEMAENVLHDAMRVMLTNPDAEFGALDETLYEGGVGAAVGAIARGLVESALHVRTRGSRSTLDAAGAEESAARAETLAKLGEVAKLKGRDAESFRELVAQIADENGDAPTELFIDGEDLTRALNQSGMSRDELEAIAPVVAQQLDAAMTGAVVRIPVSEFMAAGEAVTTPLVDFLRSSPEAMNRSEATTFVADETKRLEEAFEQEVGKLDRAEAFKATIANVQNGFEAELTVAKRFTPAVNKAYATLLANFYGTQAARTGMTPEDFAAKYQVRTRGVAGEGDALVDQAAYHGTPHTVDKFTTQKIGTGEGAQAYGWGMYFAKSKDIAEFYRKALTNRRAGNSLNDRMAQVEVGGKPLIGTHDVDLDATLAELAEQGDIEGSKTYVAERRARWAELAVDPSYPFKDYAKSKEQGWAGLESDLAAGSTLSSKANGKTYQVEVPEDTDLLDYHAKLKDQPPKVQAALAKLGFAAETFAIQDSKTGRKIGTADSLAAARRLITTKNLDAKPVGVPSTLTGKDAYEALAKKDGPEAASRALLAAGVPGLRYLDAGSRGDQAQRETHNFVIFDDSAVQITSVLNQSAQQTETPEFKRWFGDSKVVDADGKPLVVYHVTGRDFDSFKDDRPIFVAFSERSAQIAASGSGKTMRLYARAEQPSNTPTTPVHFLDVHKAFRENPQADSVYVEDEAGVSLALRSNVQVKSATDNKGTFDPADPNILNQSDKAGAAPAAGVGGGRVGRLGQVGSPDAPRAQIALPASFESGPAIISLLSGADLSSFLHESGHLFLEVQADLAAGIQRSIDEGTPVTDAERGIVADMNALLKWFGVQGSPELSALQTWTRMTLDEKRESHEKFARGFEAFAMEGNSPSIELQGIFQQFRSWLVSVYKTLAGLNVKLDDDVRAVMSRMLATDEAIAEAEAQRSMGPLFSTPEQAGMTLAEFNAYQALGKQTTDDAKDALATRSLKDMKWLGRARDKALKARQAEVEELRREMRSRVRGEVYAEPVYQAWQFLTGRPRPGDAVAVGEKAAPAGDSLLAAMARMGGVNRDDAARLLGVNKDDFKRGSGLFGKPVFRKDGGLSADEIGARLLEAGYLTPDENGKHDNRELEERIAAELRGQKQYAIDFDYGDAPEAPVFPLGEEAYGKLNTTMLREQYGTKETAAWRKLSALRMTSDTGVDPEQVAATFDFDSGDALVKALSEALPPKEAIEARTDQRMLEEYGDITSQEALDRAADEAVHSEARARFVAAELKALQDAGTVKERRGKSSVDLLAKAAKSYAAQIVARQRVRDLRPAQYAAASARSSKLAEKALADGKLDEAAMHKRNQLVNHYAAAAAYDAQAEVKKTRDYLRKFDKPIKSIDREYHDQIDQMLEGFDLKQATLKEVDRRKALGVWVAEQQALGAVPDITPELLAKVGRQSYKDMTVEELRGLTDAVKQIEHLGRLKNKLLTARDQRAFDEIVTEMAESIVANGGKARPVRLEERKGIVPALETFYLEHRKLSSLARQMDGGKDDGPMWDRLIRPMNERVTTEDVMIEQATEKLAALYAPIHKMRGGVAGARSKVFIPEINASLTRGGRLAVALNWGNADNRQRLLSTGNGGPWTETQVRAIMKTLTAQELAFVNATWEFLDSYWPQVADKQRRVTGSAPDKVEAVPFVLTSADGVEVPMRGGYYPITYSTDRSGKARKQQNAQIIEDMKKGALGQAMTRRGHTKARLEEVRRPLKLDLDVITQHTTQVVHDLVWHEWLIDANRILGSDEVSGAVEAHYGPGVMGTFYDGIEAIAVGDLAAQTAVESGALWLRANVSRATMGLSLTTAFLQPFGLTQSMARIGVAPVLRGAARWAGDAAQLQSSMTWIAEKSDFMRLRGKTFNRELREISARVGGKSKAAQFYDGTLFFLMKKLQMVADVPTWIGQYEKTMSEGPKDDTDAARAELEQRAVDMADRAVRESQGGGHIADLSELQRKNAFTKVLTQFYSYFNVTLNLSIESTVATDFKNPRAVAGWLGDMSLLIVIPAILPAMVMHALKGGADDDGEEDDMLRAAKWQAGYLLGMVVGAREFSGSLEGFDYGGPPVARAIGNSYRAIKQTAQGEVDEALVLSYANAIGTVTGLPMVQIMRSYKGWKAWDEGEENAGPGSILLGPPPKD